MREAKEPPDWFRREIAAGLGALYVLRLQGAPVAESMETVARLWGDATWEARGRWLHQYNVQRVQKAFAELLRECERWPAPAALIERIAEGPDALKALPTPKLSPAKIAANKVRFRALGKQVARRFKAPLPNRVSRD